MAVSPFQPVEDLDIDFDHMDDQYQPVQDDAMEDYHAGEETVDDVMAEEELGVLKDDDMLEDEQDHNGDEVDVGVSAAIDQETVQELVDDEDILYDDDHEGYPNLTNTANPGETTEPILDQEYENPAGSTAQQIETSQPTNEPEAEKSGESKTTDDQPAADTHHDSEAQDEARRTASNEQATFNQDDNNQGEGKVVESADKPAISQGEDERVLDLAAIEDSAVEQALRSIRVIWDNAEWTLFSTQQDATDCFFQETAYAYEPMDKFLEACRNVIPKDDLGQHDELTFTIEELGLSICEDSKYAPAMTLAHVIELYLSLHRNGSEASVTIIPCALHSRTCLQTYYKSLLEDAMNGRNLSEVAADSVDSADEANEDAERHIAEAEELLFDDETMPNFSEGLAGGEGTEAQPELEHKHQPEDHSTETAVGNETLDSTTHESINQGAVSAHEEEVGDNDLLDVLDEDVGNQADEATQDAVEDEHTAAKSSPALNGDSARGQQVVANFAIQDFVGSQAGATPVAATPALYEDPGAPAPVDDDDYNSEEEMLRLRQQEFAAQQPELEPQISFGATNGPYERREGSKPADEPQQSYDPFELPDEKPLDETEVAPEELAIADQPDEDELDFISLAPETPQKGSDKKRKAVQDDDEFDLSAFDTPEPKRRRPS